MPSELQQAIAALEERAKIALDDESVKHLCHLYDAINAEAWYDPASDDTKRFAEGLLPHIRALQDKLKFRK